MARPRLLAKRGKLVRDWTVKPAELKALLKVRKPRAEKIKTRALRIEKAKLRVAPTQFVSRDLLLPERWWPFYFCRPRYRVRKNQKNLSQIEWQRFIHAIEALAESAMPSPTYSAFVQIHMAAMDTPAGMTWGAHTMSAMGHNGRNFLAWHREYLAKIEARLIAINPLVTIPYWDWVTDRSAIPPALSDPADLADWGITRGAAFNGNSLATAAQLNALLAGNAFDAFQSTLEAAPFHNRLHGLVGGTMMFSSSPADPLFWLHHAFIDKVWADWQALHPGVSPSNPSEVFLPLPIMTRTVAQVLDTRALGYVYG
jgi:tyrosinase